MREHVCISRIPTRLPAQTQPVKTLRYYLAAVYTANTTNNNNKCSIYSTSSYEDQVHTPISSTHQFITTDVSINMAPPSNSPSIINGNTIPVSNVPQNAWDVAVHSDGSSNNTPASLLFHEKFSYQNTRIISKKDGGIGIDHCVLASKIIDRDEIVSPETITKTSVIDHKNLISLTHPSHNSSPKVADYQVFPGIPLSPPKLDLFVKAVSKSQNNLDNLECVDMDLSDDNENPESNNDQKFPLPLLLSLPPPMPTSTPPSLLSPMKRPKPPLLLPPLPPPMSPPMPFDMVQQSVPDVAYQWKQPSRPWKNNISSFNENQWNKEQFDQCFSNIKHNQPQIQWPIHVQRIQSNEGFKPKWKGLISNWPSRDPRIFNQNSRMVGILNQGPCIGPKESALRIQTKEDYTLKGKKGISNYTSRDPRIFNRYSRLAGTLNRGPRVGSGEPKLVKLQQNEKPVTKPLDRK
ncbi:hypothetical protein QTP88_001155 [Uroleucon formosanum]